MDLPAAGALRRLPVWQKIVSTIFSALCRKRGWRSLGKRRKKRAVPAGESSRRDSRSAGPQRTSESDLSAANTLISASPAPPAIPSTARHWASASSEEIPPASLPPYPAKAPLRSIPSSSPHRTRCAGLRRGPLNGDWLLTRQSSQCLQLRLPYRPLRVTGHPPVPAGGEGHGPHLGPVRQAAALELLGEKPPVKHLQPL